MLKQVLIKILLISSILFVSSATSDTIFLDGKERVIKPGMTADEYTKWYWDKRDKAMERHNEELKTYNERMKEKDSSTSSNSSTNLNSNNENSFTADLLTGDTRLACEAILCLSSSTRPSQCNPSIKRYFSISYKHWSDTVKARANFLKLCPVGSNAEKDREFTNLRDNIITNLDKGCDLDQLNFTASNYKLSFHDNYEIKYQINPKLTSSCKALSSSSYTDIRPVYTCDPNKWYKKEDWQNGYEKIELKSISRSEWKKLSAEERSLYSLKSYDDSYSYVIYEKKEINKNCWIWQK